MGESFLRELMHVYSRDGNGLFVMLECFLDDSGTHDRSSVIAWGGVFGHRQYLLDLEKRWLSRLQRPCGDRPPIKAFHSYDLARGVGEFADYSLGERDRTRYNFRKIIVDTGLTWITYAISRVAWNKHADTCLKIGVRTPERYVFARLIQAVCDTAHDANEKVSFQFDQGRQEHVASIIQPAIATSNIDADQVSYGFSAMSRMVALQAADLVAHETYQYFSAWSEDQSATPDAHLSRLLEDAYSSQAGWIGSAEIKRLSRATRASLEWLRRKRVPKKHRRRST